MNRIGVQPSQAVAAGGASALAATAGAALGVDKLGVASSMMFVSFNVAMTPSLQVASSRRFQNFLMDGARRPFMSSSPHALDSPNTAAAQGRIAHKRVWVNHIG